MLTACEAEPGAYFSRGNPETLLSTSSDLVTIDIGPKDWNYKLNDTILADPPIRAKLNCSMDNQLCVQARDILNKRKLPFEVSGKGQDVQLIYQRVVAHDCLQRYVDDSDNGDNVDYMTFGCSVMANTVQSVSDKHQFTDPHLLDFQDGASAAAAADKAFK